VSQRLTQIMTEAKGRVLISCFATSMHRLQIVADLAYQHGRKLCFVGRSIFQNSEIAMQWGGLQVPPGLAVPPQEPSQSVATRWLLCFRAAGRTDVRHGRAWRCLPSLDLRSNPAMRSC